MSNYKRSPLFTGSPDWVTNSVRIGFSSTGMSSRWALEWRDRVIEGSLPLFPHMQTIRLSAPTAQKSQPPPFLSFPFHHRHIIRHAPVSDAFREYS